MPIRRVSVLLCLTAVLPAQQDIPPNEVTFRASSWAPRTQYVLKAETRLVEVGVVVRDSRNHSVGGLTRGDVIVEEGGKPREITAFTAETATHPASLRRTHHSPARIRAGRRSLSVRTLPAP